MRRDRLTWVLYVLLAWFAFLQAAPGLVIVYLRDELGRWKPDERGRLR